VARHLLNVAGKATDKNSAAGKLHPQIDSSGCCSLEKCGGGYAKDIVEMVYRKSCGRLRGGGDDLSGKTVMRAGRYQTTRKVSHPWNFKLLGNLREGLDGPPPMPLWTAPMRGPGRQAFSFVLTSPKKIQKRRP